jgi:hypothetical protein
VERDDVVVGVQDQAGASPEAIRQNRQLSSVKDTRRTGRGEWEEGRGKGEAVDS